MTQAQGLPLSEHLAVTDRSHELKTTPPSSAFLLNIHSNSNFFPFFFFASLHILQDHINSFRDQGLNLCPAVNALSPNHWTAREFPQQQQLIPEHLWYARPNRN